MLITRLFKFITGQYRQIEFNLFLIGITLLASAPAISIIFLIFPILNGFKNNLLNLIKDKFNYVINLAGYVDHSNKKKTYDTHYKGCVSLVKIFRETKLDVFLQVGSCLEYGKLNSPQKESEGFKPMANYGKSKFLATKFLLKNFKSHKFPAIIIRAYQIYGPKQDNNRLIPIVITNCLKNNSFYCSEGSQLRDFLYINDFIFAIYRALKCKKAIGKIINIGYGKPYRVKDVINKI